MSHTYATLKISAAAYDEIRTKLADAGYGDSFINEGESAEVIDMHGIGLIRAPEPAPTPTTDIPDIRIAPSKLEKLRNGVQDGGYGIGPSDAYKHVTPSDPW